MYDDNYLVLCGMVWAQSGEQRAGLELVRALDSPNQLVRVLARTLLQANGGSKELSPKPSRKTRYRSVRRTCAASTKTERQPLEVSALGRGLQRPRRRGGRHSPLTRYRRLHLVAFF